MTSIIDTIRIEYKKTISDNQYGNETMSVSFSATIGTADDPIATAHLLTEQAKHVVLGHLRQSPSPAIRQALETPELRAERLAQARAARAEEGARWREERAARAVLAHEALDDDDDDTDDEADEEIDLEKLTLPGTYGGA